MRSAPLSALFRISFARLAWSGSRSRIDQELDVADDDAEQIVEVVGNAAGELADRLHFLRLAQFRLHPLLARDVL